MSGFTQLNSDSPKKTELNGSLLEEMYSYASNLTKASGDTNALLNFSANGSLDSTFASSSYLDSCSRTCMNLIDTLRAQAGASGQYLSLIELEILRSKSPLEMNETQEAEVFGQRGLLVNKAEIANWRGTLPIHQYPINDDPAPRYIRKKPSKDLEYVQEVAIRYLRPPTPPSPGDILIQQEANVLTPPAPPLVLRQMPNRPTTPVPLVIREAPPQAPLAVGRKLITISGKRLPPPPRKVVIERFASLPAKPQNILVERWLPYTSVKRRVIYRAPPPEPRIVKPKNVIIEWESPKMVVKQEFKYLDVIRADPVEYTRRYGASLHKSHELPSFVYNIETPHGLRLSDNQSVVGSQTFYELEGDVAAMALVDLDKEDLGVYREYLTKIGVKPFKK